jgi:hypothetical protein
MNGIEWDAEIRKTSGNHQPSTIGHLSSTTGNPGISFRIAFEI